MKKMHVPSRLLSMLLVLALLCGFAAPVGAAGSSSTGLSLTQVDNSAVSASLQEQAVEEPEEADYADTDMVRVSIVMETARDSSKSRAAYRPRLRRPRARSWMWSGT